MLFVGSARLGYPSAPGYALNLNNTKCYLCRVERCKIQKIFLCDINLYLYSTILYLIFLCSPKKTGGTYSRRLVRPSVCPSVRIIRVRPITSLFKVGFQNYFTEMTTMLRRRAARNIWIPTVKVKVRARPCCKIVSGA